MDKRQKNQTGHNKAGIRKYTAENIKIKTRKQLNEKYILQIETKANA